MRGQRQGVLNAHTGLVSAGYSLAYRVWRISNGPKSIELHAQDCRQESQGSRFVVVSLSVRSYVLSTHPSDGSLAVRLDGLFEFHDRHGDISDYGLQFRTLVT